MKANRSKITHRGRETRKNRGRERAIFTSGIRQLTIIFDKAAKSQVERKKHLKKVSYLSLDFDLVRRNMKIHKVMRMQKTRTDKTIGVQVVTSTKGRFSDLKCIYDDSVLDVFQHHEKYIFNKLDWKWQDFYNVTKPSSKSVVLQTDNDEEDMQRVLPDVEGDIGVLKKSVQQLLAQETRDVVAINTHPGHHAGPKKSACYCMINNAVFAATLLKSRNPGLKLAVIDIDVHPGDGTQAFINKRQHLIKKFVSIHSTRAFWKSRMNRDPNGIKYGFGSNAIALKKDEQNQVSSERVLAAINKTVKAWTKDHLNVIIVSLGFDTLKSDPLAGDLGFQMRPADFYHVGHMFSQCPAQFLFVQEGGYDVTASSSAFAHLFQGFREGRKIIEC